MVVLKIKNRLYEREKILKINKRDMNWVVILIEMLIRKYLDTIEFNEKIQWIKSCNKRNYK